LSDYVFASYIFYFTHFKLQTSLWAGKRNYEKTGTTNGVAAFHIGILIMKMYLDDLYAQKFVILINVHKLGTPQYITIVNSN